MKRYVFAMIIFVLVGGVCNAGGYSVPSEHYLGISVPCRSVSVAREMAIFDVTKQIMRTIGAYYTYKFSSLTKSNTIYSRRYLTENFVCESNAFISQVEQNIVSSGCELMSDGYVCKVLVRFSDRLIRRMRRLSHGPRVVITKIGDYRYRFQEISGVSVVLSRALIVISEVNSHARFLNYYVMKTPYTRSTTFDSALEMPINLSKKRIVERKLMVPTKKFGLRDILYGTKRDVKITLFGVDEIGRDYSVVVP